MDEMQERTWDLDNRFPNMLLDLNPASKFEMKSEYRAILADLATIYRPEGLAEQHCLEMMAIAMWCQRRAVCAETQALNLDHFDQAREIQHYRSRRPEGYTAAEQTTFAMDHVADHNDFYNFLLRYRRAQTLLFQASLRDLRGLKKDRVAYQPQLAFPDDEQPESSASLRHRMQQYKLQDLQNEPNAA